MLLRLSFPLASPLRIWVRHRLSVVLLLLLVRGRQLLLRLLLLGVSIRGLQARRAVLRVSVALEEGRGRKQHGLERGTSEEAAWL